MHIWHVVRNRDSQGFNNLKEKKRIIHLKCTSQQRDGQWGCKHTSNIWSPLHLDRVTCCCMLKAVKSWVRWISEERVVLGRPALFYHYLPMRENGLFFRCSSKTRFRIKQKMKITSSGVDILCWRFSSLNILLDVSTPPHFIELVSERRWNILCSLYHLLFSSIPHFFCSVLFCLPCVAAPSTWCDTGRHVSVSPWRRSTSRIWSWGTRSSRRLWRGTYSHLRRTPSSSPCSAPSKRDGTSAWSWSTLKVRGSAVVFH